MDTPPTPTPLPVLRPARTIQALSDKTDPPDLPALVEQLNGVFASADSQPIASTMAVHAHVLDTVFNHLLTHPNGYESRSLQTALALRSQRQCLDTLEILSQLATQKDAPK